MCVSLTTQKHCILVCNSTPYQQIKSQQSLNYADLTCAQLLNMFTDVCHPSCHVFFYNFCYRYDNSVLPLS